MTTRRYNYQAAGIVGAIVGIALGGALLVLHVRRDLVGVASGAQSLAVAIREQAGRVDTVIVPFGSHVFVGDSEIGTLTTAWRIRPSSAPRRPSKQTPVQSVLDLFRQDSASVLIFAIGPHERSLHLDSGLVGVVDSPMTFVRPLRVRLALGASTPRGRTVGYLTSATWRVIPIFERRPGA